MKSKVIILCLLTLSGRVYAQQTNDSCSPIQDSSKTVFVEKQVTTAYNAYLDLQKALVKSDSEQAKKAAVELQEALKQVDGGKEVLEPASRVTSANSLAAQRDAFTELSSEMLAYVRSSSLKSGEIHVGYCPMANANTGGSWLTSSKEILNPYYGEMMLTCGSIKETIQ